MVTGFLHRFVTITGAGEDGNVESWHTGYVEEICGREIDIRQGYERTSYMPNYMDKSEVSYWMKSAADMVKM